MIRMPRVMMAGISRSEGTSKRNIMPRMHRQMKIIRPTSTMK